jgi:hypothetical protein
MKFIEKTNKVNPFRKSNSIFLTFVPNNMKNEIWELETGNKVEEPFVELVNNIKANYHQKQVSYTLKKFEGFEINFTGIKYVSKEGYDELHYKIESDKLIELQNYITCDIPNKNTINGFSCCFGYVKEGMGPKYVERLASNFNEFCQSPKALVYQRFSSDMNIYINYRFGV